MFESLKVKSAWLFNPRSTVYFRHGDCEDDLIQQTVDIPSTKPSAGNSNIKVYQYYYEDTVRAARRHHSIGAHRGISCIRTQHTGLHGNRGSKGRTFKSYAEKNEYLRQK